MRSFGETLYYLLSDRLRSYLTMYLTLLVVFHMCFVAPYKVLDALHRDHRAHGVDLIHGACHPRKNKL